MKINIGTKNQIKINACKETIRDYDFLAKAEVFGIAAASGVGNQPKTLEETVCGAKNRARNCFGSSDLSVGVEDGLMAVPQSLTGFMNITAAAFFDGNRYYLGLSAGFEYPPKAINMVKQGLDINQVFYKMKLTNNPKIGSEQGAVGILTKNRWHRKDTVKQALVAALIQLENKKLYQL